jgi:hypothetical protein
MSKRYIHLVDDDAITTGALLKAMMETNPTAYPVGGHYALLNGLQCVVQVNDGTTVTVGTVTVTVP